MSFELDRIEELCVMIVDGATTALQRKWKFPQTA